MRCGERVCPGGTACIELVGAAGERHRCVDPSAISACSTGAALTPCSATDLAAGACYTTTDGFVCLPSGCGNSLVDQGEACDDGNADVGDGCSAACRSTEMCGNGVVDPIDVDDNGNFVLDEVCDDANLGGHDGCTSGCLTESAGWAKVSPAVPLPRIDAPMVYDPIRRRIVLFAGHSANRSTTSPGALLIPRGDTWESDGEAWIQMTPSLTPTAREGAAMAYDGARRNVIMFAGYDGTLRNDTWVWTGTTWSLIVPPTSPAARSHHGMAYDGRRKVVVMFGGAAGSTALRDTWEWNGTTWRQATPAASPTVQGNIAMTYDPVRAVIVLVGSDLVDGPQTWEYDGTTWTQRATTTTPQVTSIAFDAVMSRVLAYGDQTTTGFATYTWDGTTWTFLNQTGPGAASAVSVVTRPGGHVLMFGGEVTTCGGLFCLIRARDETWSWNGTTWTKLVVVAPKPRFQASATLDTRTDTIVMVGGADYPSVAYAETWEYDGVQWRLFPDQPWATGRYAASIAYDQGRDEIVVFGGYDASTVLNNETWIRKDGVWSNPAPATVPTARGDAMMAYDAARKQVVLFGGTDNTGVPGAETWLWSGTTWRKASPVHSPPARAGAMLAWDPIAREVVLFGGGPSMIFGDTWTWDGTDWTERTLPFGPSARYRGNLAWDAGRRSLVLFGGTNLSGNLDDSWEWSNRTWGPLVASDRPLARESFVMASAPGGAGVFIFGGSTSAFSSNVLDDAWRLRWDAALDYEECALHVDDDADGKLGCDDVDCWARCSPSCPPGAACDPAAPRCGDGVCNDALEDCRTCPGDCVTCAAMCGDWVCDPGETVGACPGDCTP